MIRVVEMKLYLTAAQQATLASWMRTCCWLYNRCLDQRIKAYRRRSERVNYQHQCRFLTDLRRRVPSLESLPLIFERDSIRRLDRAFATFFRRCKAGERIGFPRFRASIRYSSLECLHFASYVRPSNLLWVPKLGLVPFRAGDQHIPAKQKLLRIIRRASGWFAQVVVDDGLSAAVKKAIASSIGIDLGLESFATLSNGEKIANPRFFRSSERGLKRAQRRLSRCQRHSRNRRKAVKRVGRIYERIVAQRKDFAHQQARRLVNCFDLIAVEKIKVKSLAASKLAKFIRDAAWGIFTSFIAYKAECAGKTVIAVNPHGTSQTCPECGAVQKKTLKERVHRCPCGLVLDRDHAAAKVILARALGVAGANACGGDDLCNGNETVVSRAREAGSLVSQDTTHHGTQPPVGGLSDAPGS